MEDVESYNDATSSEAELRVESPSSLFEHHRPPANVSTKSTQTPETSPKSFIRPGEAVVATDREDETWLKTLEDDLSIIGPLDQTNLSVPLSNDTPLRFVPARLVSQELPEATEICDREGFVGAVIDPGSGKIYSIEKPSNMASSENDGEEKKEESISWCSAFLLLRILGLCLVLAGILLIVLTA